MLGPNNAETVEYPQLGPKCGKFVEYSRIFRRNFINLGFRGFVADMCIIRCEVGLTDEGLCTKADAGRSGQVRANIE